MGFTMQQCDFFDQLAFGLDIMNMKHKNREISLSIFVFHIFAACSSVLARVII